MEHGADEEVLRDVLQIEGVAESSLVYGEFDIHCKVLVDSMDALRKVIREIRKLKIMTTETLIAYEKIARVGRITNNHVRRLRRRRER